MTSLDYTKTTKQSAKKEQMSVAARKELLSLRHRFGGRTSCKGRLTTRFRLVNSGKILSRDGRRQMSIPYYYRAWTAFPHFLIRFTRAIQRNEKGWDTLFCCALAVAPLCVIDYVESSICEERSNPEGKRIKIVMNNKKKKYPQTEHRSEK
ncbi:MAG: hypothetical protein IKX35_06135 [Bacteroidales bacterium]|nr:hypothetical protein [Bacteroidales bacterium]